MSINFDDTLQAIYFLSGRDQDWMAGINQQPDGTLTLSYRFRYYDPADPGNDAHSGKDRKSWTHMSSKPGTPLQESLDAMQKIMSTIEDAGYVPKGGISCTLIRGSMTTEQFMEAFSELPFVHKQTGTLDDAPKPPADAPQPRR